MKKYMSFYNSTLLNSLEQKGKLRISSPRKSKKNFRVFRTQSRVRTKSKRTAGIVLLPLILSGCMGIYEGGFECPPGEGVGCKSISEVNEMVNQGEVLHQLSSHVSRESCASCALSPVDPEVTGYPQAQDPGASQIWWAPWALTDKGLEKKDKDDDPSSF